MKKQSGVFVWIIGILFLGAFGACIRGIELIRFLDPVTNLYTASGAFALVLPLLSIAAAAAAVWFGLQYRDNMQSDFLTVFSVRSKICVSALVGAGLLLLAAGAMKTLSALGAALETILPFLSIGGLHFGLIIRMLPLADIAYGLITFIAGTSVLSLTKVRHQEKLTDFTRFVGTIPIFWACFLVIMTFMEHPVEPVMQVFAYDLIASASIVLAVYNVSAFLFQKGNLLKTVTSSLLALFFIAVTAGGRAAAFLMSGELRFLTEVPFRMVVFIAMFIYIIINLVSIGQMCVSDRKDSE